MPYNVEPYVENDQLSIDGKKLKKCKYNIDLKILNIEEEPIEIPYINITRLEIEKYYTDHFFPICKIVFFTSNKYHYAMIEKKDIVKFDITLKKFDEEMFEKKELTNNDTNNIKDPRNYKHEIIFQDIFVPIIKDDIPFKDKALKEGNRELSEDSIKIGPEGESIADTHKNEFYIFPEKAFSISKKIHNQCFKNTNVLDVIGYLVNESTVDKLLINNIDNEKTYKQVIIPPLTLPNALEYLHLYYGIYNTGLKKFYDIDKLYILNKDLEKVPIMEDEYEDVLINIMRPDDDRVKDEGCYKDDEKKIYFINTTNSSTNFSTSSLDLELYGNKIVILDPKRIKYGTSADDAGNMKFGSGSKAMDTLNDGYDTDDRITYVYNSVENDVLAMNILHNGKMSNKVITFGIRNCNIDFFKINKRFILFFEDMEINDKYAGVYMIDSHVSMIIRQNNELNMEVYSQIKLNQVDTLKYKG